MEKLSQSNKSVPMYTLIVIGITILITFFGCGPLANYLNEILYSNKLHVATLNVQQIDYLDEMKRTNNFISGIALVIVWAIAIYFFIKNKTELFYILIVLYSTIISSFFLLLYRSIAVSWWFVIWRSLIGMDWNERHLLTRHCFKD